MAVVTKAVIVVVAAKATQTSITIAKHRSSKSGHSTRKTHLARNAEAVQDNFRRCSEAAGVVLLKPAIVKEGNNKGPGRGKKTLIAKVR